MIKAFSRKAYETLQQARRQQETEEWRQRYAARAGIEDTLAQALQLCGLRRCRYAGLAKTWLQHPLTAIGLNIVRLEAWWTGRPLAKTGFPVSPLSSYPPHRFRNSPTVPGC